METPFFFPGEAGRLFGVLHQPPPDAPRRPAVLFCHPFGEEKLWAHRVFVTFARELAGQGHPVLRFDYRGNGDSEGPFTSWTVSGALTDIFRAIDELEARTGRLSVILLGLRLGATLAAVAADARDDVAGLVLWAPITDGRQYAQDLLRVNVVTQLAVYREVRRDREALVRCLREGMPVNVDGYDLTEAAFDELAALRLDMPPRRTDLRCLLVQVAPGETARRDAVLCQLQRRYEDAAAFELAVEEPFWKEIRGFYDRAPNLFARTTDWLTRSLPAECAP